MQNEHQPKLSSSNYFSEHHFLKPFINSENEAFEQTDGYDLPIIHSCWSRSKHKENSVYVAA
jgi:hypothetical protein